MGQGRGSLQPRDLSRVHKAPAQVHERDGETFAHETDKASAYF